MKRAVIGISQSPNLEHQKSWGLAFKQGLERHGWQVRLSSCHDPCDLFVQWGVRRKDNIERAKVSGSQVCIIERGYVGDRKVWSSVSFGGGLNGRGVFRGPFDDPARWDKNFAHLMQDWRADNGDGYALIMGQVVGDSAVADIDLPRFYDKARKAFEALGWKTAFRPHPHIARSNAMPINEHFRGARCAVTWNSNSAVDAVLAGVPAVALDEGSMAWDVTGHDLTPPPRPDREAWAHALAWKQYTKDEMESGYCWEMVKGD